ncbi:MAG: nucleotidyltransferase domain-containing protein [Nitrospinae bacterium]|nr:nucleotidyltransferase domain-containing protein [Nitrospinota bacterium]
MSEQVDITEAQRALILDLLDKHLPNTTAWLYGSRAKGEARPQSDLDMVVFADPARSRSVYDLKEAFEESNLPFRVDVFGRSVSGSASCPITSFSWRGTPRFHSGLGVPPSPTG